MWSSRRGAREIEHLGSAHDEEELEALKAAARQRLAAGQLELGLGLEPAGGGPLPITSSRMGHLADALEHAYRVLGFEDAAEGDEVFRELVLARIIEPASKIDSLRVLEEAGIPAASYRTVKRRLPVYAEESWRQRLSAACAGHAELGPASLVLYDVSTLYFETDQGVTGWVCTWHAVTARPTGALCLRLSAGRVWAGWCCAGRIQIGRAHV